jgi:hypothetical protein
MADVRKATGKRRLERTTAEAWEIHKARAANRPELPPPPSLKQRFEAKIVSRFGAEIDARGGETEIEEDRGSATLRILDRRDGLYLLGCTGWRQYSRSFGARQASLAYLCGVDDNGDWAVRVPGTCSSVSDAIDAIEPPQVKKAREDGRTILRQGDVYAVEQRCDRAAKTAANLPATHTWDNESRVLTHDDPDRPHAPLHVPFRCSFYAQRALGMGRGAGRGIGMAD